MNKFHEHLSSCALEIDKNLESILKKKLVFDNILNDSIYYSSIGGGKRFRGFLTIETAKFFNANTQNALNIASAIELIHSYSLIHDDLPALDNDDLRRSKPSNHIKYDEATSILAGDAIQSLAFEVLSEPMKDISLERQLYLINQFSLKIGANGMVGGQIIDISSKKKDLTIKEIKQMHKLKTASLIGFSCKAGAIIGGAREEEIEAFELYGENLGIAFQIIDDVLDKTGDKDKIGKTIGKDELSNTKTYLSHFDEETSIRKAEEFCNKAISSLNIFDQLPENFINALEFITSRKF
ncbi:MAG: polyprenyl synthetase family protein [Alphaproteobacteria bacterium]|jgi:farnesyl diphosphate synthase